MTVRQHETVAIGPDWILRIEPHHAIPNRVDEGRQSHRCAGVSGLGLLDGIHGERADGVDRQLSYVRAREGFGHWSHFVTSSRDATLASRRRWRSAWLNSDARNVSTKSHATDGPIVRPPRQMMFMGSASTPWRAEKWSPIRQT